MQDVFKSDRSEGRAGCCLLKSLPKLRSGNSSRLTQLALQNCFSQMRSCACMRGVGRDGVAVALGTSGIYEIRASFRPCPVSAGALGQRTALSSSSTSLRPPGLWVRNMHLACWSLIAVSWGLVFKDGSKIRSSDEFGTHPRGHVPSACRFFWFESRDFPFPAPFLRCTPKGGGGGGLPVVHFRHGAVNFMCVLAHVISCTSGFRTDPQSVVPGNGNIGSDGAGWSATRAWLLDTPQLLAECSFAQGDDG